MTIININKNWWDNLIFKNSYGSLNVHHNHVINAFLSDAISNNKPIYTDNFFGRIKETTFEYLTNKFIEKLNLQKIINWASYGEATFSYFISDDFYLEANNKNLGYYVVTINKEKYDFFVSECKKHIEKYINDQGAVNVLVQGPGGYNLTTIGVAGVPLRKLNYNDSVLNQYNEVVKDLCAKNPAGRITILTGEPGTGKTYIVRALLQECKNVTFIFIPSYMVGSLNAPTLLPVLAEEKENNKPIILVIEDADSCLVKRQADNASEVSTLLNLGDGVLGSLLDIRIICTTNAKKLEIDSAILRNGRLCQLIEVNKLNVDKANNLLKDLLGHENFEKFERDVVLADVYAKARELGWSETEKICLPNNIIPSTPFDIDDDV